MKKIIKSKIKKRRNKDEIGSRVVIKLAVPKSLAEKLKFVDNYCKNDFWFARDIERAVESKIQDIFISVDNKFVLGQIDESEYKKIIGRNPSNLTFRRRANLELSKLREMTKLRNEILRKDMAWFIGIPKRIETDGKQFEADNGD